MALNALGQLTISIVFRDQSAAGTKSATKNVQQLGQTSNRVGKQMQDTWGGVTSLMTAGLTAGLIRQFGGALMSIARPAIELEEATKRMRAFADTGKQSIDAFLKSENAMGRMRTTAFSTGIQLDELVIAFTELSKKGLQGKDALDSIRTMAELAVIANTDMNQSVEIASTLYTVWGIKGSEMTERMGQLAAVAAASRLGFDELTDVITRSAAGVAIAQPTFEDFLMLMGMTRNISQSAAITGTQLKVSMIKLAKGINEIAASFGVATNQIGKNEGKMRSINDIIFEVVQTAGNTPKKLREVRLAFEQVAGTRGVIPVVAVLEKASKALTEAGGDAIKAKKIFEKFKEEALDAVADGTDFIGKKFDEFTTGNVAHQLRVLNVALADMGQSLGPLIIDPLMNFAVALTTIFRKLSEGIRAFNKWREEAEGVELFLSKLLGVLGGVTRAFIIWIGILGLGKAALFLYSTAFKFTVGELGAGIKSTIGLTLATRRQKQAVKKAAEAERELAASIKARSAAQKTGAFGVPGGQIGPAPLSKVGKVTSTFGKFFGVIGSLGPWFLLLIPVVAGLIEAFGFFTKDTKTQKDILEKALPKSTSKLEAAAEKLAKAGDKIGAAMLHVAGRMEALSKEKVPLLKTSDLAEMQKVTDHLAKLNDQFAKEHAEKVTKNIKTFDTALRSAHQLTTEGKGVTLETLKTMTSLRAAEKAGDTAQVTALREQLTAEAKKAGPGIDPFIRKHFTELGEQIAGPLRLFGVDPKVTDKMRDSITKFQDAVLLFSTTQNKILSQFVPGGVGSRVLSAEEAEKEARKMKGLATASETADREQKRQETLKKQILGLQAQQIGARRAFASDPEKYSVEIARTNFILDELKARQKQSDRALFFATQAMNSVAGTLKKGGLSVKVEGGLAETAQKDAADQNDFVGPQQADV
jgi:TP901 family phage tail tape measure protein